MIAAWAVNHGIEESHEKGSYLTIPAKIFPIYFPFGNMATGFLVILSLLAGVVGFATSISGFNNVIQWNAPNLHAAAAFLLFLGHSHYLPWKWPAKRSTKAGLIKHLRTLEVILILLSGTQLFFMGAIHIRVEDVTSQTNTEDEVSI